MCSWIYPRLRSSSISCPLIFFKITYGLQFILFIFFWVWDDPQECGQFINLLDTLKDTLKFPSISSHQLSRVPQSGVRAHILFSMLDCWLTWSWVGSHSCCESRRTEALFCLEDTGLLQFFLTRASSNLPGPLVLYDPRTSGIGVLLMVHLWLSIHTLIFCTLTACTFLHWSPATEQGNFSDEGWELCTSVGTETQI